MRYAFNVLALLSLGFCLIGLYSAYQAHQEVRRFISNLGPNAILHSHDSYFIFLGAQFPYWTPICLTAALPIAWLLDFAYRRMFKKAPPAGLCPACGYDLRASTERCPECGRMIESSDRVDGKDAR